MILYPITVINYSYQFKFNRITIAPNALIDVNNAAEDERLYLKVGLFLEESEIIFLEIDKEKIDWDAQFVAISLDDIKSIRPLSRYAEGIVRTKIASVKVGSPIDRNIASRIINYRNREVAKRGSECLLHLLGAEKTPALIELEQTFSEKVSKFRNNVHYNPDSIYDHILKYERSKPFPMNDLGIMLDCGSLLKSNFAYDLLPENELKEMRRLFSPFVVVKDQFEKRGDIDLMTLIKALSEYPEIRELNEQIPFFETPERFNFIASIMIYLKMRMLIRDEFHVKYPSQFISYLRRLNQEFEHDALNAIVMLGMRFGIHEFVTLFEWNNQTEIKIPESGEQIEVGKKKTGKVPNKKGGLKETKSAKKETDIIKKTKESKNSKSVKADGATKKHDAGKSVKLSGSTEIGKGPSTADDVDVDGQFKMFREDN